MKLLVSNDLPPNCSKETSPFLSLPKKGTTVLRRHTAVTSRNQHEINGYFEKLLCKTFLVPFFLSYQWSFSLRAVTDGLSRHVMEETNVNYVLSSQGRAIVDQLTLQIRDDNLQKSSYTNHYSAYIFIFKYWHLDINWRGALALR